MRQNSVSVSCVGRLPDCADAPAVLRRSETRRTTKAIVVRIRILWRRWVRDIARSINQRAQIGELTGLANRPGTNPERPLPLGRAEHGPKRSARVRARRTKRLSNRALTRPLR